MGYRLFYAVANEIGVTIRIVIRMAGILLDSEI
jgi:hypothetical protein